MAILGCNCNSNCTGLAVVSSLIIGIITFFLQITAVITVTPIFYWVTFGIAILFLAISFITATFVQSSCLQGCLEFLIPAGLTGILGTILTSLILLSIDFAATSIIGAIVLGLLVLFFTLIITTIACVIKCLIKCNG